MKNLPIPGPAGARIGLLDAMGYGNLGDAAIQDSVIANIRKRVPHARIVGFSFAPADTSERHGIACYPLTRHFRLGAQGSHQAGETTTGGFSLKQMLRKVPVAYGLARMVANTAREVRFLARSYRVLLGLDVLVMSGGGQLGDLWGGPWGHPYNLLKFSVLAKLAGKRLYFLNVGAESLKHWLSKVFVKWAVRLADYVSFRDVESQTQVRNLGVTATTYVYPDPVYALEPGDYLDVGSSSVLRPVAGINPLGFCDPRVWPHKDQSAYEAYLAKLTRMSVWLLEQGYDLKLFTTSPGVDRYAIADLKQRVVEQPASSRTTAGVEQVRRPSVKDVSCASVKDVLREMGECDLIVTSRYHGVVFSHLLQKPVVGLGYDRKVNVAMQAVGFGQFCESIEHFSADWLIHILASLTRGGDALKSQQARSVGGFASMLHKQFDELFLPSSVTAPVSAANSARSTICL